MEKLKGYAAAVLGPLRGFQQTFFSASLPTFFFWSSLFYIFAGTWCMISLPTLKAYLCGIPPEDAKFHTTYLPKATRAGLGCANCTDDILTCGKSACFQAAFGRSYLIYGAAAPLNTSSTLVNDIGETLVTDKLELSVVDAISDPNCNEAIKGANTIQGLVLDVITKRAAAVAASDDDGLTAACVKVQCQNLFSTLIPVGGLALDTSVTTTTTGAAGAAAPGPAAVVEPTATAIPECASEAIWSFSQAKTFFDNCEQFSDFHKVLPRHAYDRIIAGKNTCMKPAITNGINDFASLFEPLLDIRGAATATPFVDRAQCFSLLTTSNDLITLLKNVKAAKDGGGDSDNACGNFFCRAFFNSGVYPGQTGATSTVVPACVYNGTDTPDAFQDISATLIADLPTYCNTATGGSLLVTPFSDLMNAYQTAYTTNAPRRRRELEGREDENQDKDGKEIETSGGAAITSATAGPVGILGEDEWRKNNKKLASLLSGIAAAGQTLTAFSDIDKFDAKTDKIVLVEDIITPSTTSGSADELLSLAKEMHRERPPMWRPGQEMCGTKMGRSGKNTIVDHPVLEIYDHDHDVGYAKAKSGEDELEDFSPSSGTRSRGHDHRHEREASGTAAGQNHYFHLRTTSGSSIPMIGVALGVDEIHTLDDTVSAERVANALVYNLWRRPLDWLFTSPPMILAQRDEVEDSTSTRSRSADAEVDHTSRSIVGDHGHGVGVSAEGVPGVGVSAVGVPGVEAPVVGGVDTKTSDMTLTPAQELLDAHLQPRTTSSIPTRGHLQHQLHPAPASSLPTSASSVTRDGDFLLALIRMIPNLYAWMMPRDPIFGTAAGREPYYRKRKSARGQMADGFRHSTGDQSRDTGLGDEEQSRDTRTRGTNPPPSPNSGSTSIAISRILQANDDLPEFEEGDWSLCGCYTMCMPGLQTRKVECFAAACMLPKPATKQSCECTHCADCQVLLNLLIIAIFYFVQGGCAFIVWLGFVYWSGKTQDELVGLRIWQKFLAILCKKMPLLVRILTVGMFVQITLLGIQAFLPYGAMGIEWQADCKFPDMWLTTGVIWSVWLFQLVLGVIAKLIIDLPPYLFTPATNKQGFLMKLLRWLGP
ncbi:unnamed protein product [Amoebophrya sp. A25]|nr:unnamed protein product [Amoebophrya sp. A25]|eukprot:GSA25T00003365001.1